jgi:hypothetical protein
MQNRVLLRESELRQRAKMCPPSGHQHEAGFEQLERFSFVGRGMCQPR